METELFGFLERQFVDGMKLASESDLFDLLPVEFPVKSGPPVKYLARFSCTGLIKVGERVEEANEFFVAITFAPDHLAMVDPLRVVTWLGPENVYHANIGRGPLRSAGPLMICVGRVRPGVPLVDLLYQTFDVITYNKVTMTEKDALNWDACQWARWNMDRFPVDQRPLKRASRDLQVREIREKDGPS